MSTASFILKNLLQVCKSACLPSDDLSNLDAQFAEVLG